jgi:type IV pilus assembly protein PilY1
VPLFKTQTLPPNLVLNLAINTSTTGGAYRNELVFVPSQTYIGYFNPDRCYNYNAVLNYFFPVGTAAGANRICGGKFSGNFMNWATMSTVDILRYSLTGGKRDGGLDSPTLTVLERSNVQNTFAISEILLPTYFPRKVISLASVNNYTPYINKPGNLRIVNCAGVVHFGDGTGGDITDCGTPKGDGNLSGTGMQVKVQVCDAGEGLIRTTLPATNPPVNPLTYVDPQYRYCTKYGANFKPEGELQRNPLLARISVFAYPNVDSPAQYGGVLRRPAKFVGPRRLDALLNDTANPNKEWDENTGMFIIEPDPVNNQFFGGSGIINYINKFDTTYPFYTTNNPVGELYYDSIRYLANIGSGWFPGDDARLGPDVHGNNKYSGFEIYKNWTDPVMASCQSHYALTIGDANTAWDRSLPGGLSNNLVNDIPRGAPDAMGLDARAWTNTLFNTIGPGVNQGISPDATAGLGNAGYYFAGASYWARSKGFRPRNDGTGTNHTLTSFFMDLQQPAPDLIKKRPYYFAAIGGAFVDKNSNNLVESNEWPYANGVPANSQVSTEGQTFTLPTGLYLTKDPRNIVLGIKDVFARLTNMTGNLAGLPLSTPLFNPSDTSFVQTGLEARNWSGQVYKYYLRYQPDQPGAPLQRASTPDGTVDDAPAWEAGALLTAKPAANRSIFAGRSKAGGSFNGAVELKLSGLQGSWDSLSALQKAALNTSPVVGVPDGLGRDRLAFLLGDRTTELGQTCNTCVVPGLGVFRTRSGVLGDIVNGGSVIVGKPAVMVGEPGYAAFASTPAVANRPQMVYVSANDGMLHAFDGKTGEEKFAYIPNAVFSDLNKLTAPTYIHRPFVDGPLLVAEANTTNGWKSVLAGTFGAGAQGVMALDITDPNAFGTDKVLWEFTDKDDGDIGNVTSQPKIAKVKINGKTEYFIVVSGGYNNYQPDALPITSNSVGDGYVFMLSLNKPQAETWSLGSNYFKFKLELTTIDTANGVGGVAVDTDNNNFTTAIFAGDLQGNLWKVLFPSDNPNAWAVSKFAILQDAANNLQPITADPTLVAGPGKTTVVVVGTGRLLSASDLSGPFQQQTVYGIWDVNNTKVSGTNARARLHSRKVISEDPQRTIGFEEIAATNPEPDFVYGKTNPQKQGWYFDLPSSGERMVFGASGLRSILFANTIIPNNTTACSNGDTWSCALDGVMGRSLYGNNCVLANKLVGKPSPIALPAEIPVSGGGITSTGLAKGKQRIVSLASVAAPTNGTNNAATLAQNGFNFNDRRWRQMNWREIINWQELKNNPAKTLP